MTAELTAGAPTDLLLPGDAGLLVAALLPLGGGTALIVTALARRANPVPASGAPTDARAVRARVHPVAVVGRLDPQLRRWLRLVAAIALLFTTRHPAVLFALVVGLDRWAYLAGPTPADDRRLPDVPPRPPRRSSFVIGSATPTAGASQASMNTFWLPPHQLAELVGLLGLGDLEQAIALLVDLRLADGSTAEQPEGPVDEQLTVTVSEPRGRLGPVVHAGGVDDVGVVVSDVLELIDVRHDRVVAGSA